MTQVDEEQLNRTLGPRFRIKAKMSVLDLYSISRWNVWKIGGIVFRNYAKLRPHSAALQSNCCGVLEKRGYEFFDRLKADETSEMPLRPPD
jgi:hypothetical protein